MPQKIDGGDILLGGMGSTDPTPPFLINYLKKPTTPEPPCSGGGPGGSAFAQLADPLGKEHRGHARGRENRGHVRGLGRTTLGRPCGQDGTTPDQGQHQLPHVCSPFKGDPDGNRLRTAPETWRSRPFVNAAKPANL